MWFLFCADSGHVITGNVFGAKIFFLSYEMRRTRTENMKRKLRFSWQLHEIIGVLNIEFENKSDRCIAQRRKAIYFFCVFAWTNFFFLKQFLRPVNQHQTEPISALYSCWTSNKQLAHKHPSYSSLTYCTSFSVSCTVLHWHLVNELALHSKGASQRSQRIISCFIIFKSERPEVGKVWKTHFLYCCKSTDKTNTHGNQKCFKTGRR